DRLMAVMSPIRYKTLPQWVHGALIIAALLYAFIITGIGAFDMGRSTVVAVCMPPTAFNPFSRLIWIGASFLLGLFTLFVYAIAQYKCARMGREYSHLKSMGISANSFDSGTVEKTNRNSYIRLQRMLNSLTVVILVYASTWFLTVCALFVTQLWARDTDLARTIESHLAWLVIA
ncbi:hypothetical protein PMAYCL1PPCAC_18042, partial [Pristionchus mayeri]